MNIPNYITKRQNGIYHFRFTVPQSLRHFFNKSKIHKSLGTREPRTARILAGTYLSTIEEIIKAEVTKKMDRNSVLSSMGINPDKVAQLVSISRNGINVPVDSQGKMTAEEESSLAIKTLRNLWSWDQ